MDEAEVSSMNLSEDDATVVDAPLASPLLPGVLLRRVSKWLAFSSVVAWTSACCATSRSSCELSLETEVFLTTKNMAKLRALRSRFTVRGIKLLARGVNAAGLAAIGRTHAPALRALSVKFALADDLSAFATISALRTLEVAHFGALTSIGGIDSEGELQILRLADNPALCELDALIEHGSLHSLVLNSCPAVANLDCVVRCGTITNLKIGFLPLLKDVDGLQRLSALRKLCLDWNSGLVHINALSNCTALTALSLTFGSTATTTLGLPLMRRLARTLRSLSFTTFAPIAYDCIASLTRLTSLILVDISPRPPTVLPIIALASLRSLKFETLVVNASAAPLERLVELAHLESLTLEVAATTTLPARMLSQMTALSHLDISGSRALGSGDPATAPNAFAGLADRIADRTLQQLCVTASHRTALEQDDAISRAMRLRRRGGDALHISIR